MNPVVGPIASIVVVSDYAGGEELAWATLRATLKGLAAQDFEEPFECLLVERESLVDRIPADLAGLLPGFRIVPSTGVTAYDLQNAGAGAARADIVALLDADCVPDPDWLRRLVAALRGNPGVAVVSGRTTYAGTTRFERILALLDRAFDGSGRRAATKVISNNNAGYRREVFLDHPLRNDAGPFGAGLQTEAIRRAGGRLLFEPRILVVHAFEGWPMERDFLRHLGYAEVAIRRVDPGVRFAALIRLGPAIIPLMVAYRILHCWGRILRSARHYGVAWYEIPLALAAAVLVHLYEIRGMAVAFRGGVIEETQYR